MINVTAMRALRTKYKITLKELADAADVSTQYISDIELGKYSSLREFMPIAQNAFDKVIEHRRRQLAELLAEYAKHCDHLLDYIAEGEHEL